MAEDSQDSKPTEQDVDKESKKNSNGTPDAAVPEQHQENCTSNDPQESHASEENTCNPEKLCPGQMIILKALQQVVGTTLQSESKTECRRTIEPKQKTSKLKKSCKKRALRKPDGSGESKMPSVENEIPIPEVTGSLLSSLDSALMYLENNYNTINSESRHGSDTVDALDFGDLHTEEEMEEVELRKEITKDDYKDILRKAVHKICHSKSGEINPVKVNNLIKAYVQRYKYFRKHGKKMEDDESSSGYRGSKDSGTMEKGLPPLPLI
ncbi:Hypothetical predicted protein [Pelobates cultripes]|uniref:SFR19-like C-terminal domain-containing protein n=1 Tax=Pelobates cultripes TaxID=61616 RepID=A0AAD1WQH5_PELCU|nr:Hypothetical predicted protein [Pelobates cultripes]